ncbi:MAG: oligosaccharide flippase family protein [Eudoraea sp.]|nr:oligosaccharide flippase family protein [Eudoraea sp.]
MKNKVQKAFNDVDNREILLKGFSFLSIRVIGLFLGYLFTFLVAKYYGAGTLGLISLCFSLFLFAGIMGRLGLDINLVRYYSTTANLSDTGLFYRVLLKSFIGSSIIALIIFFLRDYIIYDIFKKPQLEPYFIWTVLAIPMWSGTLVCAGLLRARKSNKWFAFLNNPGRFTFTVLFFLILWAIADSPINAIKAHFFGISTLFVLSFYLSARSFQKISLNTVQNTWAFLREALPMMLSSTILVLLGWLDTFVLGIYESADNIGIYNVALKVATLTSFTLQAINSILAPKLARSHNDANQEQFHKLIQFTTRLNFFSTLVIVSVILIFREWILSIFGAEFIAGANIVIILCIGQLINSMSGSVGVIMQMTGHQNVYQNIVLIALIINIILNFTLVPIYGVLGAAIATVVSISSWNLIGAIYLKQKLNIRSYYSPFKK